jgi:YD repeat-containing protein
VPYTAGDQYVVSGYVKTADTTSAATVNVDFYDSTDGWLGQKKAYSVKGTHDWTRIQTAIDSVPTNTAKVRVAVSLEKGSGTAYFDAVQLLKGTHSVISTYNLVENESFERDSNGDSIPDNWTTSGNLSVNDGMDQNSASSGDKVYVGAYSFKLTGEANVNKYITQHISMSGDANTPLTLSGWSKQEGADPNGGFYELQVQINHTDGSKEWRSNTFSPTTAGWQHVAAQIRSTEPFESLDVFYLYYNQTGTAWFDAIRLETGAVHTSNTYDANENYVTNVKDPVGNRVSFAYDAVGNQTSLTDGKGQQTAFEYDARNLLAKVTDVNLGVTSYGYDGVGNRTTVNDAKNNVITYGYNEFTLVSSITNPLNQTIQFGYDRNGNTTKVLFPKGNEVSYSFNALNRMDGIYYNGVKQWGLGYDANGNVSYVADAAGKTTTYAYDNNQRLVQKAEGSSNKLDYTYDGTATLRP